MNSNRRRNFRSRPQKTTSEGEVFQPLIMDLATLMVMEI